MQKKSILLVFLAIFITATVALSTVGFFTDRPAHATKDRPSTFFRPSPSLSGTDFSDVAEASIPGVVNISSTRVVQTDMSPFFNDPFFEYFFGPRHNRGIPRERREGSLGSGVVVSSEGIILTNNHVVDNAEDIKVTLSDDREFEAEVVGTDPKTDVAVIKLKDPPDDLHPLPIGDSDKLRLGEVVLAIGNPFGLSHTVTMGIVSAKGRADVGIADYEDFIQTDAAINPGNSGGALINLRGELIGINTAIASRSGGYQGIGFAIPSNMARQVMDSIDNNGKVVRGWLGVAIQDIDKELADALKLDSTDGVLIADVFDNSPAKKAGLKRGDVIVKVDGVKVDTVGKLRNAIALKGEGTKVTIDYIRDGDSKTARIKLAEMPDDAASMGGIGPDEGVLGGMSLSVITPELRDQLRLPSKLRDGLVVTDIDQRSPARMSGLRPGDVILEINHKKVATISGFKDEYRSAKDKILLLVYRRGGTFYIVLKK